jgi:hypothetical protein
MYAQKGGNIGFGFAALNFTLNSADDIEAFEMTQAVFRQTNVAEGKRNEKDEHG